MVCGGDDHPRWGPPSSNSRATRKPRRDGERIAGLSGAREEALRAGCAALARRVHADEREPTASLRSEKGNVLRKGFIVCVPQVALLKAIAPIRATAATNLDVSEAATLG